MCVLCVCVCVWGGGGGVEVTGIIVVWVFEPVFRNLPHSYMGHRFTIYSLFIDSHNYLWISIN